MTEINADGNASWLSDHPLISLFDNKYSDLKFGVFNVLSDFASKTGKNAQHVSKLDGLYKKYILVEGMKCTLPSGTGTDTKLIFPEELSIEDVNKLKIHFKTFLTNAQEIIHDFDVVKGKSIDNIYSKFYKQSTTATTKNIHKFIIDELLETNTLGGFDYTIDGMTNVFDEYKKKEDFLKTQIKAFFNNKKFGILVCPEFDWMNLLNFESHPDKGTKLDSYEVTKSLTNLIGKTDIKGVLCGAFNKPNRTISDNNFCKVVFFKGLDFVELKHYDINYTTKTKPILDRIIFKKNAEGALGEQKICIFALHGDSTTPKTSIPPSKEQETKQICAEINETCSENIANDYYLMGDFNYPLFAGEDTQYKNLWESESKDYTINFPDVMIDQNFGNMKKKRPISLTNAQIEKGSTEERDYGTDFICKILTRAGNFNVNNIIINNNYLNKTWSKICEAYNFNYPLFTNKTINEIDPEGDILRLQRKSLVSIGMGGGSRKRKSRGGSRKKRSKRNKRFSSKRTKRFSSKKKRFSYKRKKSGK